MKNLIFLFLISLISQSATAQYKIDWVNAPLNLTPVIYNSNHMNIEGNVFTKSGRNSKYLFDTQGNLTTVESMLSAQFTYNEKGHVKSQKGSYFSYNYQCDERGRIVESIAEDGTILKYIYDTKGLWAQLLDVKSNRIAETFTYDKLGRIIKNEFYSEGQLYSTNSYTYTKNGSDLEIKIEKKSKGNPASVEIEKYNKRGDCVFQKGKAIKYTYDSHYNILSIDNGEGSPIIYSYNYFDEVSKNPGTKIEKKNDCISGDCENGFGSKKIDDFTYIGFFENGKPDGPGILYKKNYRFIGAWKNGISTGYGLFTETETSDEAQGYFENLVLNGRALRRQNGKFQYGRFSAGNLILPAYKMERTGLTTGCVFGDCIQQYGHYLFQNGDNYTGFFKDGNPEAGIFSDTKENKYTGEYKNGKKDGFGHQLFPNGDIYVGYFKNSLRNGKGFYQIKGTPIKEVRGFWEDDKLITNLSEIPTNQEVFQPTPPGPDLIKEPITSETKIAQKADCISGDCEDGYGSKLFGDLTYNGFFKNGKQDGPGTLSKKNYTFLGSWKNGLNTGYGLLTDSDAGYIAQGYFENLILNGKALSTENGKFQYGKFAAGNLILPAYKVERNNLKTGCIAGDCLQKYGQYLFQNGDKYIGFFKDGNSEAGIFVDSKKNQYNGEYHNGQKDGFGRQDHSNGDVYFGFFLNGMRDGKGLYLSKGTPSKQFVGVWEKDKLVTNLSEIPTNQGMFQPTPPGPGIISNQNKTKDKFDDLGFGDAVPDLNTMNNTAAIARLYPGYPSSDKKFIANKISAEAARKGSEDASVKYIAEKIEQLYSLNKNVAFDAFLYIKPPELALKALKLASPETRKYMFAEVKRIQQEYLQKHP